MGWKGFVLGGPLGALAEEFLSSDSKSDTPSKPTISDEEVASIQQVIEDGRRRGVSEIDIEISQEFARSLELNSSAVADSIPISVAAKIDRNRAGKCILHVKYLPPDATDRIRELHRLCKEGALTDKEFEQAKQRLLSQI